MSYIGNAPISAAFLTDTFSGTGSQTAYTMTVAPANTSSIIVAVTGVLQDPSTYSVSGTTLTFSAAPPSGTSNISVRYLGIPASGVTTTAYRTVTNTTATAGQTSFTIPSYTVGYVDVYRNGVYLPTSDYTATTGTTVVLTNAATVGDTITTISFYVSSVLNAIPNTNNAVTRANMPVGSVLQVVNATYSTQVTTTSGSFVTTSLTASITPSSSTSKILVIATMPMSTGTANENGKLTIYRNGSNIAPNTGLGAFQTSAVIYAGLTIQLLDSPATTSSTTYAVYGSASGGSTVTFNSLSTGASSSVITLMEIAA
jgi:hypothetical protein